MHFGSACRHSAVLPTGIFVPGSRIKLYEEDEQSKSVLELEVCTVGICMFLGTVGVCTFAWTGGISVALSGLLSIGVVSMDSVLLSVGVNSSNDGDNRPCWAFGAAST